MVFSRASVRERKGVVREGKVVIYQKTEVEKKRANYNFFTPYW